MPPEVFDVILSDRYKPFNEIYHINYDGSVHLDAFDLYKDDSRSGDAYLVVEAGQIMKEGSLRECLDYIYKWL